MKPTKAGVIGWPIGHSLSPVMHNAAYKHMDMDEWSYDANAIPPDVLKHSIKQFMQHMYVGLNVTIPFKQEVIKYTRPDAIAKAVGAANTLILPRNASTNTDVAGFINDLTAHEIDPHGMKVVLLGAGGAARAALYGLTQAGADVAIVNRTPANAFAMVREMDIDVKVLLHDEAAQWQPDLIVNSTSAGMTPNVDSSAWAGELPAGVTVYDMVYRPATTKIMQQAESQGSRAINGLGMLVRQGAAAFEIWTEREAPVDVMFAAAQAELDKDTSNDQ